MNSGHAAITCNYCGKPAKEADGGQVYPHRLDLRHKNFWVCWPCNARVGAHPDGKPFGKLATKELRDLRMQAHRVFDPIWKEGAKSRREAYEWLENALGGEDAHIGNADEDTCRRIISTCVAHIRLR